MSDSSYEKLIAAASRKLGSTPQQLKQALEKGDVASLSANLTAADKEKLRAVLANKQLMEKLKSASSPDEVMRMLGKK